MFSYLLVLLLALAVMREAESFQVVTRTRVPTVHNMNRVSRKNEDGGHLQLSLDRWLGSTSPILSPIQSKYPRDLSINLNRKRGSIEEGAGTEDGELDKDDLNTFRTLMGTLYGFAGLAHAADCFVGSSQLIVTAGFAPFYELPVVGQALALVWCFAGPLAFFLSRKGGSAADVGLVLYGLIEIGGSAFSPELNTVVNAVLVQMVVFASWVYSRQKQQVNSK